MNYNTYNAMEKLIRPPGGEKVVIRMYDNPLNRNALADLYTRWIVTI